MRYITIIFVLFSFFRGNAQEAWLPPADLQLMISRMKENFPRLKELDQLEKNFEFRRNLARGALFPIVGASLNYQYQVPVNEITVGANEIPVFPNHNYSAQVYITHPIWDFGRTKASMDKVENEQRQLQHNVELTEANLAYQLANIYYSLLFLQRSLEIQQKEIVAARESEKITTNRFKSGDALEVDVLNTQVRITQIENRITDIKYNIEKQRSILQYITGHDYSEFSVDLSTPFPGDVFSYQLADTTFSKNFDHIAAVDKLALAKNDLELNFKTGYPTLQFQASGGMKNGFYPDLNEPRANFLSGVSLSFPFFAGFRYRSMTKISRNQVAVAELGVETANAEARKNYEQALQDYLAAQEKLQRFDSQIATAEKALKITGSRFNNGLITSYEMILAQNNLESSRLAKVQVEYQRWQALLEINRVLGTKFWE